MKLFFSEYFEIEKNVIERYGAIDISLISDLPLFIDPFLIFHGEKQEYKALHNEIITYLIFLKSKAKGEPIKGELKAWFLFPEVKQNWLGYSFDGNEGRGSNMYFAKKLHFNLGGILHNFGQEKTKSPHLEKLCLLTKGIGRDKISDFTSNLIKNYLLTYTERFATQYLNESQITERIVEKANFDYSLEKWMSKRYKLPKFNNDYVLLTPEDILTKDDTWINKRGFSERLIYLPASVDNDQLRAEINNYIRMNLPKEPTVAQQQETAYKTVEKYPVLIDVYIKEQEEAGSEASKISKKEVEDIKELFNKGASETISKLERVGFYQLPENSFEESMAKLKILKSHIEIDGYKHFYDGEVMRPNGEKIFQLLYKLIWRADKLTKADFNPETNHGRGPIDFVASNGKKDKTHIEFKLARNNELEKNLLNQVEIYQKADVVNSNGKKIYAILIFDEKDEKRVNKILLSNKLNNTNWIVLIDARKDNKPTGSEGQTFLT